MTRRERILDLVAAVARQALADRGARRVALLDDGSPEAALSGALLSDALGPAAVERVRSDADLESLLHSARSEPGRVAEEVRRLRARLLEDALPAHPRNKTALLLGGALPPEPFLPLGDLYASEVEELAGGWSAPEGVLELARRAGGVQRLDAFLRNRLDRREPRALEGMPAEVATEVTAALVRGRAWRCAAHVVPKVGPRTLGVDLFE